MKKQGLCVALGLVSSVALASDYRVAYSGKEDLSIFADNATEQTWCQPQLTFRLQGGANTKEGSVEQIFPKIGKLLNKLCPSAEMLSWHYVDQHNKVQATGKTSKQEGWKYAPDVAQVAQSSAQSTEAAATSVEQKTSSETTSSDVAPVASSATNLEAAPAASSPAATSVESSTSNPVVAPVASSSEPTTQPASTPAEVVSTTTVKDENNQQETEAQESAPKEEAPILLGNFSAANWTPPASVNVQDMLADLEVMSNQDGCKLRSYFQFGMDKAYVNIFTKGLSCNDQGFLEGQGSIWMQRTDGKVLMSETKIAFVDGLPFSVHPGKLSSNDLVMKKKLDSSGDRASYFFSAGSDKKLGAHYLVEGQWSNYYGISVLNTEDVYVLVNNAEDFKHADRINQQLEAALAHTDEAMGDLFAKRTFIVVDDFDKGTIRYSGDLAGKLYEASYTKYEPWNAKKPKGPWRLTGYTVQNYVFEREKIAARKKEEQEREQRYQEMLAKRKLASEERVRLQQYQELVQSDLSTPDKVQAHIYRNVKYGSYEYRQLLKGGTQAISTFVHVNGMDGQEAVVDWPYEMRLVGATQPFKEGWYWVQGEQFFKRKTQPMRTDKSGLPLTQVEAASKDIYACQQEKCADLQDPLVMMKILYGVSDWSPEKAEQIIKESN